MGTHGIVNSARAPYTYPSGMNTYWGTSTTLILTLLVASPLLAQANCDRPSNVALLDSRNKRLFAIGSENDIQTAAHARVFLKPLANYISSCQSGWEKDWSVSIFADRKFVQCKTELGSPNPQAAQEWANAYIGEYTRRNERLLQHPLSPKAKKRIRVSLAGANANRNWEPYYWPGWHGSGRRTF